MIAQQTLGSFYPIFFFAEMNFLPLSNHCLVHMYSIHELSQIQLK